MKKFVCLNFYRFVQLSFLLCVVSCNIPNSPDVKSIDATSCEVVPVYELFDSLEVVSLDHVSGAELGNNTIFYGCNDYYIIKSSSNFYVFDKNGNFISSTEQILGHGKGETPFVTCCVYNPYSELIEVLCFDRIKKYDLQMNFVSEHRLPYRQCNVKNNNKESGCWFEYMYDLSETNHIIIAGGGLENSHHLFFYDSQKNQVYGQSSFEEEVVCTYCSWQYACFGEDNSTLYIFPHNLMRAFYRFDTESQELSPYLRLDFGHNTLTKEDIEPYEDNDYVENQRKISKYLMIDCAKQYPVRSSVTKNKLFSLIHTDIQSNNWYLLEVNLADYSVKRLNIANEKKVAFPIDFTASDGYVYCIDNDEERIRNYISSFKYPERITYSGVSDSLDCSNAVILKYKVK